MSVETDWREEGRKRFAGPCDFILGAASLDALPPTHLPEVAFIGRSNVGKSSLINALTGRKALARTSSMPGHTRQLNFFDLGGRFLLVDLPGYGYAKAGKKDIKGWNQLIRDYLQGRPLLRRACLLIDARHGLKPNDNEMMDYLDELAVSYQLLLTKCDKVSLGDLEVVKQACEDTIRTHPAAVPGVMTTSSEEGSGIPDLRALLVEICSY